MQAPSYLEIADSSLVAIRAASAAIDGTHLDPFQRGPVERFIGRRLNRLGERQRKAILRYFSGKMGASPKLAPEVRTSEILRWALGLYHGGKTYDGVVVGAPSGAVAHISALLRFPFLTQHYLLSFKGRYAPDDARAYFEDGRQLADMILKENHDLEAIVHYDPLHDRFLIIRVNFIRVKLKGLPEEYKNFILKQVKPGGTVVSMRCTYPWLLYRIADAPGDLFYQVGGLGDVPPEEYLTDSERLKEYRKNEGGHPEFMWGLSGMEPVEYPESEWGSIGTFNDELKDLCNEKGFRLIEAEFPHPDCYSVLAFDAYREGLRINGEKMESIFVDCFTHIDPRLNLITHTPPLWLPFICRDSYRFAKKMIERIDRDCAIWLSLHPSFCDPVDIVHLDEWKKLFSEFKHLNLLGIDEKRYPADLSTYVDFADATRKQAYLFGRPFALAIDADAFAKIIKKCEVP